MVYYSNRGRRKTTSAIIRLVASSIIVVVLLTVSVADHVRRATVDSSFILHPSVTRKTEIQEMLRVPTVVDPRRVCSQNPYVGAFEESLDTIARLMDSWMDHLGDHYHKASEVGMEAYDHSRFFAFDETMATCKELSCVGGECRQDESKIMCGLEQLGQQKPDSKTNGDDSCIIYSIGGNNQWEFELDMLDKTPCQVHTFDCTGPKERFHKPKHDRLHFHHVCLGSNHEGAAPRSQSCLGQKCGETWTLLEMQQRLRHKRIDLLKMDIEGFEWPLLESWPSLVDQQQGIHSDMVLPFQILVELHYRTQFDVLHPPGVGDDDDFKFGRDMVRLQAHFLGMGYVAVERDDNQYCQHCTELTLVRSRCPEERTSSSTSLWI